MWRRKHEDEDPVGRPPDQGYDWFRYRKPVAQL